jgi:hypothetical protein
MQHLLDDNDALIRHVVRALYMLNDRETFFSPEGINFPTSSSVLFLLGRQPDTAQPCLILNKRSLSVRQPGDLCCPGGSISPRLDAFYAKLLRLPVSPLTRWPYWPRWCRRNSHAAQLLSIILATGLRESFEEMRLNPLGLKFLGLLPPQSLVMFDRVIYPLVAWVNRQRRFYPNWEVEKIVSIPLSELLKSENYARYRLQKGTVSNPKQALHASDFPCFCHKYKNESEVLWGATYQMTTAFLESIFDFYPPDLTSLPVIHGILDDNYLTGKR